jgi:hypothetical protein
MFEFAVGFGSACILCYLAGLREWHERHKLRRRVDQLWEHLACGQGYLGCNAGKNCDWDHK